MCHDVLLSAMELIRNNCTSEHFLECRYQRNKRGWHRCDHDPRGVMLRNLPEGHAGRDTGRADCHVNSNMSKRSGDPAWRDYWQQTDLWWIARTPSLTPTPPAESCQLLCIWRRARCILLLHKIENIKVKKYEKRGSGFKMHRSTLLANRQARPISPTQAFISRRQLCRQMTILLDTIVPSILVLVRYERKLIHPPSHSSNSICFGSNLKCIVGSIFALLETWKCCLRMPRRPHFVAIFIKALIKGHLNSRAGSLSGRHYALPSALGI